MVSQRTNGILSLIGGVCIHLVLGSLYTWGNILPYIGSKLHHYNPETTIESTLFFIPINIFAGNITMPIGGRLDKILNARVHILIGLSFVIIGNIICAYAKDILIVIIGDFIIGLGSGFVNMVPIKNIWQYFPNRRGLVTGIISCGFGGSAFLFSFITKALVNPSNAEIGPDGYYGPEVFNNITNMFIWLACIYVVLGVSAAILIVPYKEEKNEDIVIKTEKSDEVGIISKPVPIIDSEEYASTAILSIRFLMLFIMALLTSSYGYFTVNALKLFGKEFNIDDTTLTLASSLASLGNGISRPIWGYLLDKLKFKRIYFIICGIQLILACTIYFTPMINKYVYVLWCFLSLCCEGSHFIIFPTVTRIIFGNINATEIYSCIHLSYVGGSFIGPILANFIIKGQDKIYYLVIYLTMAFFTIISVFICWAFNYKEFDYKTRKKKKVVRGVADIPINSGSTEESSLEKSLLEETNKTVSITN